VPRTHESSGSLRGGYEAGRRHRVGTMDVAGLPEYDTIVPVALSSCVLSGKQVAVLGLVTSKKPALESRTR